MVATCTGPSSIKLTKAELDEFYTFLFGDTTMGREPTPSLGVLMTAERKAWRLLALHMAKDQTLSIGAALEDIRNNSRFWSMEIDEFCLRKTHLPGPKGPRTKGKGKAQNKFAKQWDIGRGRGARAWKGKGDPGKSLDKGKPREEWPWASQGEEAAAPPPTPIENRIRSSQSHASDGKGFCKKYHAFNRCPEDCGRSHNCPVILPNEKNHRAVFDKPAPPLLGLSCAPHALGPSGL